MADVGNKELSELRARAQELEDTLTMGKAGLSDAFIEEVETQLDKEDLIKVRLLRSARAGSDRTALAEELAEAVGATLVEVKGYTVVLYKP